MNNSISKILNIKYPVVQGGMVWCSGWELASAVSNAGGLGLIGAGSMHPQVLVDHIRKTKIATKCSFGVNIPLLYPEINKIIDIVINEDVKIVFTSAGNPATWTKTLKNNGITVFHVISNIKFAQKCADEGVDGIVAEGFEAGGHNGREETTTLTIIPLVRTVSNLPLIAAGGIYSGAAMFAAMVLGADGVQIGSRFAISKESSAHDNFKNLVIQSGDGSTKLMLKKLSPTRLLRNKFFDLVQEAEFKGASAEELKELLGKGRAKMGMFEGNLADGELEIGQVAALINEIQTVEVIMKEIIDEYNNISQRVKNSEFDL